MKSAIADFLEKHAIDYKVYRHAPLNDCSEAERLGIRRSGRQLKNLFLTDNYRRRHFLLLTCPSQQVDLKQLSKQLQVSRLGFASPRRLKQYLAVEPGHVSFLSLLCPEAEQVELLIDAEIWQSELLQAHPADNTETWVLSRKNVEKFFALTHHTPQIISVPEC